MAGEGETFAGIPVPELLETIAQLRTWGGEGTLVEIVDRLVRSSQTARYDRTRAENGKLQARNARFAFAAAILSHPERRLRITRAARHVVGPDHEIVEFEDFARDEFVYYVKGPGV